jgi:hypothetical protein
MKRNTRLWCQFPYITGLFYINSHFILPAPEIFYANDKFPFSPGSGFVQVLDLFRRNYDFISLILYLTKVLRVSPLEAV